MLHYQRMIIIASSFLFVFVCALGTNAFADDDINERIIFALSNRHMKTTTAELEKMAGGSDNLVKSLLTIRQDEKQIPWVPLRAEKILLKFAHRADVQTALLEDLSSPDLKGLARIIILNLDNAPSAEARIKLTRKSIERAKDDNDFMPYVKSLQKSSHLEVQKLAREAARSE